MPTYKRCYEETPEVDIKIDEIIMSFEDHRPLSDHKVKINALFSYPNLDKYGRPIEDAIKVNKYKALACIKVTSYKDRVKGMADAEMLIDYTFWEKASTLERTALIDHELTHLQVKVDDYGRALLDKVKRPKLYLRNHDVQIGWFASVAKRYGKHSIEVKQAEILFDKLGQSYWPYLWEVTTSHRAAIAKARQMEQDGAPPKHEPSIEDPVPGLIEVPAPAAEPTQT
jgi:Putative phage metallopeptidase